MKKKMMIAGLVLAGMISVTSVAVSQLTRQTKDDLYSQIELFSYVLTTVQSDYVDEKTAKDLIYGSLKGMLAALDPHSQFMDPEEYKELKTETEGKFGGLGIEISIKDSLLTIVTPIEDTPAWKVGLKAGDKIVKIEGKLTRDINLSDAVKQLRGKPGTDVTITILREGKGKEETQVFDVKITREIIQIRDVKYPHILQDNIGYIRLTEFRENSAKEFHKAVESLKEQGADALIVDLRNNPGGLLNVAIDITEEFLPEGQTVVSTKGRHESQNSISVSTNKNPVTWPMVVLINEGSASGSEIFAGALKDNKRAVIVGMKSFGKGSVQSVIPMPDGSGLRLTTSKYFTPSGVSIHEIGIQPDVEVDFVAPKKEEDDKTDESGKKSDHLTEVFENLEDDKEPADEVATPEAEAHERLLKDNQVQAAMSVLKGIRVYQGFGK